MESLLWNSSNRPPSFPCCAHQQGLPAAFLSPFVMNQSQVLQYLNRIAWKNPSEYSAQPAMKVVAEDAVKRYFDSHRLKRRGVTNALIRWAKFLWLPEESNLTWPQTRVPPIRPGSGSSHDCRLPKGRWQPCDYSAHQKMNEVGAVDPYSQSSCIGIFQRPSQITSCFNSKQRCSFVG